MARMVGGGIRACPRMLDSPPISFSGCREGMDFDIETFPDLVFLNFKIETSL